MEYDLLLKGGHLMDPANDLDGPRDLAVTGGKVAAVDDDIPAERADKVIDVSGLVVMPGLVDIHAHMFATTGFRNAWAGDRSVLPDGFSFRSGVTTMVDTGSAGWRTFEDFRYRVLDRFEARERGIVFDVGHGGGSFCWRNAVPAIEQGFYPDSISTDIHTGSMNDEMQDMTNVMSKFLVIGLPLYEIVRESTVNPAREIGHPELGTLSVGAVADVTALAVVEGNFGFSDVYGGLVRGRQRLRCELTLLGGQVKWDWNGRTGVDWHQLPKNYGVRNPEGLIMPPGEGGVSR